MRTKQAFSLAEALITLLIVSIIIVMTAPVMTKKAKKVPENRLWVVNSGSPNTVTPASNRNIMLGEVNPNATQSIVVVGRLEFKNREGKTIGWISEDGSSSFASNVDSTAQTDYSSMIDKQKLTAELIDMLRNQLPEDRTVSARVTNKNDKKTYKKRHSSKNNQGMSEDEMLRQIDFLIKNMNDNGYGR